MNQLVKKIFGGTSIFRVPLQSSSDRKKLLLEDKEVQEMVFLAYGEGRNDVLYANTNKPKEVLIQVLKELA